MYVGVQCGAPVSMILFMFVGVVFVGTLEYGSVNSNICLISRLSVFSSRMVTLFILSMSISGFYLGCLNCFIVETLDLLHFLKSFDYIL